DIIYRRGSTTATEVMDYLPDPPSYSAVRAMLRILEEKGHLTHTADGPRYVYAPVVSRTAAAASALKNVVRTFFDDSPAYAVAALLDISGPRLSQQEWGELERMIERAKREGR